jgi:hypothetical protein
MVEAADEEEDTGYIEERGKGKERAKVGQGFIELWLMESSHRCKETNWQTGGWCRRKRESSTLPTIF